MREYKVLQKDKISPRQVQRTLILEIFGASSLILPGYLADRCGIWGILPLLCGAAAAYAVTLVWQQIVRKVTWEQLLEETPKILRWIFSLFYGIVFFLLSAWMLAVLTGLISRQLLNKEMEKWILLTLALAAGYGLIRGIHTRVRVYEVLFWFLLIPLLVILLLAALQVNPAYWMELPQMQMSGFLSSFWICFVFFSPISLLLFFVFRCSQIEETFRSVRFGFWLMVGLNLAVYLILIGIFHRGLFTQLQDPVITLMAVVKLPGEFFERQDAFMVAIWFFCLFALVSSFLFYGKEWIAYMLVSSGRKQTDTEKWLIPGSTAVVWLIAMQFLQREKLTAVFENSFLCWMFPLLLGIPFLLLLIRQLKKIFKTRKRSEKSGKKKQLLGLFLLLFLTGACCGCGSKELENRAFPLALGIQTQGSVVEMKAACPNLQSDQADQNALSGDLFWEGSGNNLFAAFTQISRENAKNMDLNHLKVLLLDQSILADEQHRRQLADFFLGTKEAAMNTYVMLTEDGLDDFFSGKIKIESSLGIYLEDMIEEWDEQKKSSYVTVADLLQQYYGSEQYLLVPVLSVVQKKPLVKSYVLLKQMKREAKISTDDAKWLMLFWGWRKELSFTGEDGEELRLQQIRIRDYSTKQKENVRKIRAAICRERGDSDIDCAKWEKKMEQKLYQLLRMVDFPDGNKQKVKVRLYKSQNVGQNLF